MQINSITVCVGKTVQEERFEPLKMSVSLTAVLEPTDDPIIAASNLKAKALAELDDFFAKKNQRDKDKRTRLEELRVKRQQLDEAIAKGDPSFGLIDGDDWP